MVNTTSRPEGYYLLTHKTRRRQFYNPRRPTPGDTEPSTPSGVVVIHTAENGPDIKPPDTGAENVARFIAGRADPGSYHTLVDSDGRLPLIPWYAEAFHDATGTNRHSTGFSVATRAVDWTRVPFTWALLTIDNLAQECVDFMAFMKFSHDIDVPIERITAAQARDRVPGFISHAELDPGRRTDPGADFPWDALFNMMHLKIFLAGLPENQG